MDGYQNAQLRRRVYTQREAAHHQIDVLAKHRAAFHHELLVAEIALHVILKAATVSDTRQDTHASISAESQRIVVVRCVLGSRHIHKRHFPQGEISFGLGSWRKREPRHGS